MLFVIILFGSIGLCTTIAVAALLIYGEFELGSSGGRKPGRSHAKPR